MKKTLQPLLPLGLLLAGLTAQAQQQAQYSQYMNNNYILNPGVAGTEDYIDLKFSYRTQWTGLEGAPRTYYASINSSLGKWRSQPKRTMHDRQRPFHALGGIVYNDVTGPTSRTGVYGSYACNLALVRSIRIALGLSVGMQQFSVDGQQLRFYDVNNRAASASSRALDGTAGVWLYSPDFYVGLSGTQLLGNTLDFSYAQTGVSTGGSNSLRRHYFATAGVRVPVSADWSLVPSVLIKAVAPAPVSVDLNAKLKYQDLLWGGLSWRATDSYVALVGVTYEQYALSYSYDAGLSELAAYHGGSHEILLGLRLKKKAKVVCTDRFW
ncbi:type IX secretion system membrane protein PorP/SprF [Hymenobacter sp. BT664]|uniref:Type IX secretion system membrane protein PorP/SprF n=1 Tax=Hymenobacter montanus TaxID=2771359 RepID=A0A927B9M0_9BACT|nr:type IX secretion system membrane protein PorP/SprF [Hymenobacter montanus]MBD2766275.1 type IX secretion system membrane protein PorP/SprF [Hymenobacter montanus]